jgi:hypothetical protein
LLGYVSAITRKIKGPDVPELTQRFHYAKLLLSQTRYLSELSDELDKNPDSRASEIYCDSMKKSGHSVLPAPINQAVFLQMAYVNLVWLSEALTDTERGAIRSHFTMEDFSSASFEGFDPEPKIGDCFRHLRNSLAHASVDLGQGEKIEFCFRSKENNKSISLSGEVLGEISEKWCFLVSNMIYQN